MKAEKIYFTLFVVVAVAVSCGNDKPKSLKQTTEFHDTTAQVQPLTLVNGITDANRGDKRGTIKLIVQFDYANTTGELMLYEIEGKFQYPVDSVNVQNAKAEFSPREFHRGLYMVELRTDKRVSHPIILNPDEPEVVVGFRSSTKLEASFYSITSKENEGWAEYYPQDLIYGAKIREKKKSRANSDKKELYDQLIQQEENGLQRIQQQTILKYPDTFLAKLMTWKQNPEKKNKDRYFDNIDFSDPSLAHTKVIHERTQEYFQLYGESSESGFIQGIDIIVEKAKANSEVLEATLYTMLDGFSQTKYDGVCRYLLDNYIFGDGCGAEMSDVLKTRSQGYRDLQIGGSPPNIRMPMLDGGTADLYAMTAKNKYTLVLFWSSWCEHCVEQTPGINFLYDQFHAKGFDILGVSVDKDPASWRIAVKDRKFKFPQVCGIEQWESKVAKDYRVVKTPVMILLDSNKTIVFKSANDISDVRGFLEKNL